MGGREGWIPGSAPGQEIVTLEEYLDRSGKQWFLTGKKRYPVQAMMVSREVSFRNELEAADYTVTDDGTTVILKGSMGEMWTSKLSMVLASYTRPDGTLLTEEAFSEKDVFVELYSVSSPDSSFAMHVPGTVSVTVVTAGGNVLHTNLPNAPHGGGDFLVCRAGRDRKPDLSSVWVLNGAVFPERYDTSRMIPEKAGKGSV